MDLTVIFINMGIHDLSGLFHTVVLDIPTGTVSSNRDHRKLPSNHFAKRGYNALTL